MSHPPSSQLTKSSQHVISSQVVICAPTVREVSSEHKSSYTQGTASGRWITKERRNFSEWFKLKTNVYAGKIKRNNNFPNHKKKKKKARACSRIEGKDFSPQSHIDTWTITTFILCCAATLLWQLLSIYHQGNDFKGSLGKVTKLAISTQIWVLSPDHNSSLFSSFSSKSAKRPRCFLGTLQTSVLGPEAAHIATRHSLSNPRLNISILWLHFPHFSSLPKHITKLSNHITEEHKMYFGIDWAQAPYTSVSRTYKQKLHYCAFTSTPLVLK